MNQAFQHRHGRSGSISAENQPLSIRGPFLALSEKMAPHDITTPYPSAPTQNTVFWLLTETSATWRNHHVEGAFIVPSAEEIPTSHAVASCDVEHLTIPDTYSATEAVPTLTRKTVPAPVNGYGVPEAQKSTCDGKARRPVAPL